MSSTDTLMLLGRYRWTVAVMALLGERGGARFSEMVHRLGLPRESLSRVLEAAADSGWVMRNHGHGHPLRPEYVLTGDGVVIAATCRAIVAIQASQGLPPDALTRWSLPVIRLIHDGHHRFNMIERALGDASPRALTASLKALVGARLVDRGVVGGFPPASSYSLTQRGAGLAEALLPLAA